MFLEILEQQFSDCHLELIGNAESQTLPPYILNQNLQNLHFNRIPR